MKLFAILLFPIFTYGQDITAASKSYDLDSSDLVTTDETLKLIPRGFVYDLQNPDSVVYLSCISSDTKVFRSAFESNAFHFPVGATLLRGVDDYIDTIKILPLTEQLSHFSGFGTSQTAGAQFVLIYYLPSDNDQDFKKNVRYFERYIRRHKKLNIKAIYPVINF